MRELRAFSCLEPPPGAMSGPNPGHSGLAPDVLTDDETPGAIAETAVTAGVVDVVTDHETSDSAPECDVTALGPDDVATEESEPDAPTPNPGKVAAPGDRSTSSPSVDDGDSLAGPRPLATCEKSSNLRLGLLPPGGSAGGTMATRSSGQVLNALLKRLSPGTGAQILIKCIDCCCHLYTYTVIVKLEILSFPAHCPALPQPLPGCWRKGCAHNCRGLVMNNVNAVVDVLLPMFNCTPVGRDIALFDLLSSPSSAGRRVSYKIAGVHICRLALCRVCGVGKSRAARVRAGKHDSRCVPHAGGQGEAWSRIYGHLWHVYESVAEGMPDKPLLVDNNPLADSDGSLQRSINAFHQEISKVGMFGAAGASCLTPSEDLPVKELPPGCPKDYWWVFLGTPGNERFAKSYGTFKAVWASCFAQILRFRSFGTHATCSTCSALRCQNQRASTMSAKVAASEKYQAHLQRQWRDRLLYWRLREKSRQKDGNWLTAPHQSCFNILELSPFCCV